MSNNWQDIIATTFFRPYWLERVLEDCAREAINSRNVKLLKLDGRCIIWNLCQKLGCLAYGVPGQACHLFERYLYTLICSQDNFNTDSTVRDELVQNVMQRFLLLMACCIQLSAKMCSVDTHNNASVVRMTLLRMGASHSNQEIISTEANIFKALGFCIPLWTSVDIGQLLATELKFPSEKVKAVALIVDLAEYYREQIETKVRWTANLTSSSQNGSGLRSLHLAAGSVAAAAAGLRPSPHATTTAPALAQLLQLPRAYIECLRDIILQEVMSTHTSHTPHTPHTSHTPHTPHKPAILKRKR